MGTHDGAVDHGVFIVRVFGEVAEDGFPHTLFGPTAEAAVGILPVIETDRQVTPGDAGAIAVEDGLDEHSVVGRGDADRARAAGQHVLDTVPLVIAQGIASHGSASES